MENVDLRFAIAYHCFLLYSALSGSGWVQKGSVFIIYSSVIVWSTASLVDKYL